MRSFSRVQDRHGSPYSPQARTFNMREDPGHPWKACCVNGRRPLDSLRRGFSPDKKLIALAQAEGGTRREPHRKWIKAARGPSYLISVLPSGGTAASPGDG